LKHLKVKVKKMEETCDSATADKSGTSGVDVGPQEKAVHEKREEKEEKDQKEKEEKEQKEKEENNEKGEQKEKEKAGLLVLVIGSLATPMYAYHTQTWLKHMIPGAPPNVRVLLIYGDPTLPADQPWKLVPEHHSLYLRCVESYVPGILQKTLMALHWYLTSSTQDGVALSARYPFVLRTNLSSFWVWKNLIPVLRDRFCESVSGPGQVLQSKRNVYAGVVGQHHGRPFVSGAGFLMSHDVVARLLQPQALQKLLSSPEQDDVAISDEILGDQRFQPQLLDRWDLTDDGKVITSVPEAELERAYHYRVKADPATSIANSRVLVQAFYPQTLA
jgi:hypothetical protein